mmetsp:Transcript_5255/g.12653  ORF Transcript_5255/g.12653 Transcript_5255/m.12653 type:complete len:671 (-) Transcript_5255:82-2094(-)
MPPGPRQRSVGQRERPSTGSTAKAPSPRTQPPIREGRHSTARDGRMSCGASSSPARASAGSRGRQSLASTPASSSATAAHAPGARPVARKSIASQPHPQPAQGRAKRAASPQESRLGRKPGTAGTPLKGGRPSIGSGRVAGPELRSESQVVTTEAGLTSSATETGSMDYMPQDGEDTDASTGAPSSHLRLSGLLEEVRYEVARVLGQGGNPGGQQVEATASCSYTSEEDRRGSDLKLEVGELERRKTNLQSSIVNLEDQLRLLMRQKDELEGKCEPASVGHGPTWAAHGKAAGAVLGPLPAGHRIQTPRRRASPSTVSPAHSRMPGNHQAGTASATSGHGMGAFATVTPTNLVPGLAATLLSANTAGPALGLQQANEIAAIHAARIAAVLADAPGRLPSAPLPQTVSTSVVVDTVQPQSSWSPAGGTRGDPVSGKWTRRSTPPPPQAGPPSGPPSNAGSIVGNATPFTHFIVRPSQHGAAETPPRDRFPFEAVHRPLQAALSQQPPVQYHHQTAALPCNRLLQPYTLDSSAALSIPLSERRPSSLPRDASLTRRREDSSMQASLLVSPRRSMTASMDPAVSSAPSPSRLPQPVLQVPARGAYGIERQESLGLAVPGTSVPQGGLIVRNSGSMDAGSITSQRGANSAATASAVAQIMESLGGTSRQPSASR